MMFNPFYLLSIATSSFFAFVAIALLVEIVLKVFKTNEQRTRSSLRLLPFLALVIDLLFSQYSVGYYINPLGCASCFQRLILGQFFPQLRAYLVEHRISLVTYLGASHQHVLYFILFASVSLCLLLRKAVQVILAMQSIRMLVQKSAPCTRQVSCQILKERLKRYGVKICVSEFVEMPLAVYSNHIIFPAKMLKTLSSDEFEAIIAHEFEHIRCKDPFVRPLYQLVSAFFWWVPTAHWIKKLEEEQEVSCDMSVVKYGLNTEAIVSALIAVSKQVKRKQALCYFTSEPNPTILRIQRVLGINPSKRAGLYGMSLVGVIAGLLLVVVCALAT